jgi:hypothetical protein
VIDPMSMCDFTRRKLNLFIRTGAARDYIVLSKLLSIMPEAEHRNDIMVKVWANLKTHMRRSHSFGTFHIEFCKARYVLVALINKDLGIRESAYTI